MARANRHFIPGYIWHITHRCHKRESLFKFSRDRNRWLHLLFEARKRYGMSILNYVVTSNHIHLGMQKALGIRAKGRKTASVPNGAYQLRESIIEYGSLPSDLEATYIKNHDVGNQIPWSIS